MWLSVKPGIIHVELPRHYPHYISLHIYKSIDHKLEAQEIDAAVHCVCDTVMWCYAQEQLSLLLLVF